MFVCSSLGHMSPCLPSIIFHPQYFILITKKFFFTINLDKDIAMLESLGSNLIFPKWTDGELEHQSMLESMTAWASTNKTWTSSLTFLTTSGSSGLINIYNCFCTHKYWGQMDIFKQNCLWRPKTIICYCCLVALTHKYLWQEKLFWGHFQRQQLCVHF